MTVVDPGALHVAGGGEFDTLAAFSRTKVPHGFHVVMIGQYLAERVAFAGYDVYDTSRQVRGFQDLIAVYGAQWRLLRRDGDDGVPHGDGRSNQGDEAQKWVLTGAGHANNAYRFFHRQHDTTQGRAMHDALVFVSPGGIGEEPGDGHLHFGGGIRV